MNEFGCFVVPFILVIAPIALVALIIAVQAQRHAERLQRVVDELLAGRAAPAPPPAPAQPETAPAQPVVTEAPPTPQPPPVAPPESEIPLAPAPIAAASVVDEPALSVARQAEETAPAPEPAVSASAPEEFPPPSPPPPRQPYDWESLIGVKLFSWIGSIALALAGILFLRYSIERGWLSPPVQMAIGLLAGSALVLLGEIRVSRKYATTANAVDAAGLAILYATLFAAHNVWHLLPAFVAFMGIVGVTALAVWLAIRRDSVFIALLGLLGGFAAPALLATDRDRPIALFGYLLAVNIGVAWVAYKRNWPLLTALSLIFTTIYQWHWVTRFLDSANLPIAAGVFLIFPIAGVIALAAASRGKRAGSAFERTTQMASALPLVFGLYAASIPAYGQNYRILFSYLFIASAGLAALAILRGHEALHLLGAGSAVVGFLIWFANAYTPDAWPHILAITLSFQAIYLGAPLLAKRFGRPSAATVSGEDAPADPRRGFFGVGTRAVYAAPLLMFVLPTLASVEPNTASALWLGSATVIMLAAIGLWCAREDEGGPFALAFVFAFVAEAYWATSYLQQARVVEGMAFFTAVSITCFVVMLAGDRRQNLHAGIRGADYYALSGLLLTVLVALEQSLNLPPWPFLTGGAIIILGAAITSRATMRMTPFSIAVILGNLALLAFQIEREQARWPSLAVILASALAAFCGAWMLLARRPARAEQPPGQPQPMVRVPPEWVPFAFSLFGGYAVTIFATDRDSPPSFALMLAAQLFFTLLLLALARWSDRHGVAVGAAIFAAMGMFGWREGGDANYPLYQQLLFGAALYAPFIAYPVTLRERIRNHLAPYLATVIASIAALLYFWTSLDDTSFNSVIGLLPLAIAAILGWLLRDLLRLDPRGEARRGRLALLAAAVLAFVTAAVPMQLDNEWVTVAWALEAAALAWLWKRIDHRHLLYWSAALGAAVFIRLTFNPALFEYHQRDVFPILNWYLFTYIGCAAALYVGASLLRPMEDRIAPLPRTSSLFAAGATILLFLLLNIEIADYYSQGEHLTFNFSGTLAQDLTYTLGWALFAIALLVAGIVVRNHAARMSAIGLLAIAVVKCFLHDLGRLGGLYRVGSLVGLALSLGVVAVLLQRFVLANREPEPPKPPDPALGTGG